MNCIPGLANHSAPAKRKWLPAKQQRSLARLKDARSRNRSYGNYWKFPGKTGWIVRQTRTAPQMALFNESRQRPKSPPPGAKSIRPPSPASLFTCFGRTILPHARSAHLHIERQYKAASGRENTSSPSIPSSTPALRAPPAHKFILADTSGISAILEMVTASDVH